MQTTTKQQQTTTTYFINCNSPHASFKRFSTSAAAVSKICRVSGTDTSISGPSGPSGKYASWAHSISRNASKIWVSSQSERCMPQCSTLPCSHVYSMSKPFQPQCLAVVPGPFRHLATCSAASKHALLHWPGELQTSF